MAPEILLVLGVPLAGGIALALFGVFLVVTKGSPASAFAGGALAGDLVIFLGALCWVIYTMSGARFAGWSPLRFTVLTCLPGAAGLFLVNGIAIASGIARVPSAEAIGAIGCPLGARIEGEKLSGPIVVLGLLGVATLALAVIAIVTAAQWALGALCVLIVALWAGATLRHSVTPPRRLAVP